MVLVWLFKGGDKRILPFVDNDDTIDTALEAKDKAIIDYKTKLNALGKKREERLQNASEAQIKEYEEIKDKPLEEIATWIDKLS